MNKLFIGTRFRVQPMWGGVEGPAPLAALCAPVQNCTSPHIPSSSRPTLPPKRENGGGWRGVDMSSQAWAPWALMNDQRIRSFIRESNVPDPVSDEPGGRAPSRLTADPPQPALTPARPTDPQPEPKARLRRRSLSSMSRHPLLLMRLLVSGNACTG